MKKNLMRCITTMALFAATAIPVRMAGQEQQHGQDNQQLRYTVTDLGTLGGTFSVGRGINNKGWVSGNATLTENGPLRAFVWRKGSITDLGTLGGPNSAIFLGLNDAGQVAGAAETSTPDPNGQNLCGFGTHLSCLAFLWQNGVMNPLPALGGNNAAAYNINNRGQAVGSAENTILDSTCPTTEFQAQAVIWEKGAIQKLPTVSGDPDGYINAINDNGQAVGGSGECAIGAAFSLHAVLWNNRTATDLGNLGGALYSGANAINEQGQVIGSSDLPGDTNPLVGPFTNAHGFLWQRGAMTDLGTLPGDVSSFAFGINTKGQVIGLGSRAFLWQDGVMTDLNAFVPGPPFSPLYLLQGFYIDDRGEIAGLGLASTGELHAFLATPCGEDSSDTKRCNSDAGGTAAMTPSQTAPVASGSAHVTPGNPRPGVRVGGMLDRPHARQFPGRHFPGSTTGPTN